MTNEMILTICRRNNLDVDIHDISSRLFYSMFSGIEFIPENDFLLLMEYLSSFIPVECEISYTKDSLLNLIRWLIYYIENVEDLYPVERDPDMIYITDTSNSEVYAIPLEINEDAECYRYGDILYIKYAYLFVLLHTALPKVYFVGSSGYNHSYARVSSDRLNKFIKEVLKIMVHYDCGLDVCKVLWRSNSEKEKNIIKEYVMLFALGSSYSSLDIDFVSYRYLKSRGIESDCIMYYDSSGTNNDTFVQDSVALNYVKSFSTLYKGYPSYNYRYNESLPHCCYGIKFTHYLRANDVVLCLGNGGTGVFFTQDNYFVAVREK